MIRAATNGDEGSIDPSMSSARPNGIEFHGVDTIPEEERTGRPRDVFIVLLGSNLSLGTILFGWLPVSFGLGFWSSVSSVMVGTVLGTLLVAPLALISTRTATNLSTSSGAQFGVRGRLIGSMIGLLLALGYTALIIWTGGGIVVNLLDRLVGTGQGAVMYSAVYFAMAGMTIAVAVFGYRSVVKLNRRVVVASAVLLILGLAAYAPTFATAPIVHEYAAGDYWTTWALSVLVAGISGPVAYITILGDYTRYISPSRHRRPAVLGVTGLGLFIGLLVPQLFGTFTAFAAQAGNDYIGPLVQAAPGWFLIPLLLSGLFGTIGNSGLLVYDMGLDLDAIIPKLTRVAATVFVAGASVVLVFLGHFAWDATATITAFVLMLTALATPWAVITLIGYFRCRGQYDLDALQIYNRRSRGGIYWYSSGWSLTATFAWAAGAVMGLLCVDTSLYRGPLLRYTNSFDLSFLIAAATAGAIYVVMPAVERRSIAKSK